MYLTKLTLNPRCRRVRRDLASQYEMHRTLMRAFPSRDEGGPGRVLFRVESPRNYERPIVLVQSEKKPDWRSVSGVPELAEYAALVEEKQCALTLRPKQRLRFRLHANPTVKREGKRHGLHTDEQRDLWLKRKADAGGFHVLSYRAARVGTVRDRAQRSGGPHRGVSFTSATFEGVLEVAEPALFLRAVESGIGSAKGFGFGLLSVAPLPSNGTVAS